MAEMLNNLQGEQEVNETRLIALQRIRILFRLAKEKIRETPQLSQRYVEIARKIAMRTKLRLPKEYRYAICRHCKKFIYPGVNCRVRLQQKRKPHVVKTCLICGKITRIPLNSRRPNKEKKAG
jgi:ribonuclease P protein subunit RPR2